MAKGNLALVAQSLTTERATYQSQVNRRISGLQQIRAIAALLVVMFHAASIFSAGSYFSGVTGGEQIFRFGHAGVEIFFVLSGLIIAHIHLEDPSTRSALLRYILSRLIRIYPPVFIAVSIFIVLKIIGKLPVSYTDIATSYTLIPFNSGYSPYALWTLTHELVFYALFSIFFFNKNLALLVIFLWGLAGVVIFFVNPNDFNLTAYDVAISPYNMLFFLGILAYLANKWLTPARQFSLICVAAGTCCFIAVAAADDILYSYQHFLGGIDFSRIQRVLTILFGGAAGLVIFGVYSSNLEIGGKFGRMLFYIGDASFSIYLWHETIQRIIVRLLTPFNLLGSSVRFEVMTFLVVLSVAAGCLLWSALDGPMTRALRRRFFSRPKNWSPIQ